MIITVTTYHKFSITILFGLLHPFLVHSCLPWFTSNNWSSTFLNPPYSSLTYHDSFLPPQLFLDSYNIFFVHHNLLLHNQPLSSVIHHDPVRSNSTDPSPPDRVCSTMIIINIPWTSCLNNSCSRMITPWPTMNYSGPPRYSWPIITVSGPLKLCLVHHQQNHQSSCHWTDQQPPKLSLTFSSILWFFLVTLATKQSNNNLDPGSIATEGPVHLAVWPAEALVGPAVASWCEILPGGMWSLETNNFASWSCCRWQVALVYPADQVSADGHF